MRLSVRPTNWSTLPAIDRTYQDIASLAERFEAKRVVLFGSRARGTNLPKSDIDLAVEGCRCFDELADALKDGLWTLLSVDVINLDDNISDDLRKEIDRDGVVLYEKI